MANIQINATIEGHIDKYEAYKALCEEVGLRMLVNGTANNYAVEDNILYKLIDKSCQDSSAIAKEVYSKDFKTVMLFESLLSIKHYL